MKPKTSEELFDLIGETDEKLLMDAKRCSKRRYRIWIPIVAATLALLLFVGGMSQRGDYPWENETTGRYEQPSVDLVQKYDDALLGEYLLAHSTYPVMAQYPADENDEDAYHAWWNENRDRSKDFYALSENELPTAFFSTLIRTVLSDTEGDNKVCSPVNVYMALAILAETADGESRAEILSLLGAESIESLRTTAGAIWRAHYCDDGAVTSILASSIWLDKGITYVEETVERIAELYYASSFRGEMGSEELNEALRAWIDSETGGLLSDSLESVETVSETVFALVTTVFFRAKWVNEFNETLNEERVFHGENGDILCEFMTQTRGGHYRSGEGFSAIALPFSEGGSMYLILPDRNKSVDSVLAGEKLYAFLASSHPWESARYCEITARIPKFDVSSSVELSESLREMGLSSVFSAKRADFSPITDMDGICLSKVQHSVRVAIDEEGCIAAAYTAMTYAGSAMPTNHVEFVLDRPFIFVITSDVGLPLFVGVVNTLG